MEGIRFWTIAFSTLLLSTILLQSSFINSKVDENSMFQYYSLDYVYDHNEVSEFISSEFIFRVEFRQLQSFQIQNFKIQKQHLPKISLRDYRKYNSLDITYQLTLFLFHIKYYSPYYQRNFFLKNTQHSYTSITKYGYLRKVLHIYKSKKSELLLILFFRGKKQPQDFIEMSSSSNNQVSGITSQMQITRIRDFGDKQVRRVVGSSRALSVATNEWKHTLIGKLHSKDLVETEVVRKEVIELWKQYKTKEIRGMDKNIYLFKFSSDEVMKAVLKKVHGMLQRVISI